MSQHPPAPPRIVGDSPRSFQAPRRRRRCDRDALRAGRRGRARRSAVPAVPTAPQPPVRRPRQGHPASLPEPARRPDADAATARSALCRRSTPGSRAPSGAPLGQGRCRSRHTVPWCTSSISATVRPTRPNPAMITRGGWTSETSGNSILELIGVPAAWRGTSRLPSLDNSGMLAIVRAVTNRITPAVSAAKRHSPRATDTMTKANSPPGASSRPVCRSVAQLRRSHALEER